MSYSYNQSVNAAMNRANALIDFNTCNDMHQVFESVRQTLLVDDSLTENERNEAIMITSKIYDTYKIINNEGTKRICENCNQECLATTYCELCVRNYLKENFSNWTSGNDAVDNLIKECQLNTLEPIKTIEWIPYNNLKDIEYLTKGGCSEIYTAIWIDKRYDEWDSREQRLKRMGKPGFVQSVILKGLENVENASPNWFEEVTAHLILSTRCSEIVQCYGLTQDPSNKNYMLVLNRMDIDLRKYLQQNHKQLTWKERIQIAVDIANALAQIHYVNAIHRDLHSGNILFRIGQSPSISDLGFCGPADRPLKSIYGNLPYVAPEVINGKEQTFESDIYGIAMLMWEISSGRPPFNDYEHDIRLAMNIVNGIRPKIVPGTPLEYKNLMEQCWDADPSKRPHIITLRNKLSEIYQNSSDELLVQPEDDSFETEDYNSSNISSTSKLHYFENLPSPRNATEEEQEAFHSKSYDFDIPNNIDDFNKSSDQKDNILETNSTFKDVQSNDKIETMQQEEDKHYTNVKDDDDIYNNPNIHSEEQDELGLSEKLQSNYKIETMLKQGEKHYNIDDDDDIYNNPNIHSEDQDVLNLSESKNYSFKTYSIIKKILKMALT
ncbi:kinase-like protein [Rhizophagus irregularis]|uniref:Kinase-like protein n=1 Tax=Rhizophagus irregularis TaxID=588596 RepID=A0A2I1GL65_9GLOM|nr:kinase-like protein [Rhizophagus irregularis]